MTSQVSRSLLATSSTSESSSEAGNQNEPKHIKSSTSQPMFTEGIREKRCDYDISVPRGSLNICVDGKDNNLGDQQPLARYTNNRFVGRVMTQDLIDTVTRNEGHDPSSAASISNKNTVDAAAKNRGNQALAASTNQTDEVGTRERGVFSETTHSGLASRGGVVTATGNRHVPTPGEPPTVHSETEAGGRSVANEPTHPGSACENKRGSPTVAAPPTTNTLSISTEAQDISHRENPITPKTEVTFQVKDKGWRVSHVWVNNRGTIQPHDPKSANYAENKEVPESDQEDKPTVVPLGSWNKALDTDRRFFALPTKLAFAHEGNYELAALIDTGASCCILPRHLYDTLGDIHHTFREDMELLEDFCGNTHRCFGRCDMRPDLHLGIQEAHEFKVVETSDDYIIIGNDYLRNKGSIIIHCGEELLINRATDMSVKLFINLDSADAFWEKYVAPGPRIAHVNTKTFPETSDPLPPNEQYTEEIRLCHEIAMEYESLHGAYDYRGEDGHSATCDLKLIKNYTKFAHGQRNRSIANKKIIEDSFNEMMERRVLRRGLSEFASPVHIVRKKNGRPRICVDFRKLNLITEDTFFPIPRIDDIFTRLRPGKHTWFSCLDIAEAYYAVPMSERAQHLAAIKTHHGCFLPLRMPFGLKQAPAIFCAFIAEVISGLEGFVFAYLDDFLIFSETFEEHVKHLRALLERLVKFKLHLSTEKCKYARRSVIFLGHELSAEGLRPLSDKVEAVKKMQPPRTVTELRRFLGMVGYYRPFLPAMAETAAPLYKLTGGPRVKGNTKIPWDWEHQDAFDRVIKTLSQQTTLNFEDAKLPLVITSDASNTHAGAVLEQFIPLDQLPEGMASDAEKARPTRPLAFYSKAFPRTVAIRSTFNRELTALHYAVKFFNHRLRGRQLIIRTDHKALVAAVNNGYGDHSPNEERMVSYIMEFSPIMVFLSGELNHVADLLSRPVTTEESAKLQCGEIPSETSSDEEPLPGRQQAEGRKSKINNVATLNFSKLTPLIIAEQQKGDPNFLKEMEQITSLKATKLKLVARPVPDNTEMSLVGVTDESGEFFRPALPPTLRVLTFNLLHNAIHQGKAKSVETISSFYYWPRMAEDIALWVKSCPECQTCKITRHNRARLTNYPRNNSRLHTLHTDLVGPLEESDGFKYVLTLRDRVTGFMAAAPIKNKASLTVVDAFKRNFIGILGIPSVIISDNGREFNSNVFKEFCDQLGIRHKFTCAYHPQANGAVERVHRTLKQALRALRPKDQWSEFLPLMILAMNNLLVDNNKFTPYQKVFGQSARLPGTFFYEPITDGSPDEPHTYAFLENMRNHLKHARPLPDNHPYIEKDLFNTEKVWVRNDHSKPPLAPLYSGPFTVLQRNEKYFVLMTNNGTNKVSVDRLKAAFQNHDTPSESRDMPVYACTSSSQSGIDSPSGSERHPFEETQHRRWGYQEYPDDQTSSSDSEDESPHSTHIKLRDHAHVRNEL